MTKIKAINFRVDEPTLDWLTRYNDRADQGGKVGVSAQIEEDLNAFRSLIGTAERSLQGFLSIGEAMLLLDVTNSSRLLMGGTDASFVSQALAHEVLDAIPDGLGEKWGIEDMAVFSSRLAVLSPLEGCALYHWCLTFWAHHEDLAGDEREAYVRRLFRCRPDDDANNEERA